MKFYVLFLLATSIQAPLAHSEIPAADPYQPIETIALPNGLKLVLAPSPTADTVAISAVVKAGQKDDPKGKAGTAHLLEHYLFEDPALKKGLTYLDLIKEKGGVGNGVTKFDETEYYASIQKAHAGWMLDIFGKILFKKNFTAEGVESAKKPVYLEIGRPGPIDFADQMRPSALVKFLHVPSFWEREFGIEEDHGPNLRGNDRFDTGYIQAQDVEKFYSDYYAPANITVFVAGGFDPTAVRSQAEALFGSEPGRPAQPRPAVAVNAKVRPYTQTDITSETPQIELGAKVINITGHELIAARVYLSHLAHRLMKDLRNIRGETYTVSPNFHLHHRHGFASIRFETSPEQYRENLAQVKTQLRLETQGGITPEMFEEARQLFGKSYTRTEKDADSMMGLAKHLVEFRETYPEIKAETPFGVFSALSHESYSATLKSLFRSEMAFEQRVQPPLVFRYDPVLFSFATFCLWMLAARTLLSRKFPHDRVRWVRKVRYFPAYMVQIATLLFGMLFVVLTVGSIQKGWNATGLSQLDALISNYAKDILEMGAVVFSMQACLMFTARKAMIVGDALWIKSLGYWSSEYPLNSIQSLEQMHPLRFFFLSPLALYRTGFRIYYYFDLKFWNKGMLIRLKNKKCIFLCLTDPDSAYQELCGFMAEHGDNGKLSELRREDQAA